MRLLGMTGSRPPPATAGAAAASSSASATSGEANHTLTIPSAPSSASELAPQVVVLPDLQSTLPVPSLPPPQSGLLADHDNDSYSFTANDSEQQA